MALRSAGGAAHSCTVSSACGRSDVPIACGRRSTAVLLRNSGLMDRGAVSVRAVLAACGAAFADGTAGAVSLERSAVSWTWYLRASCRNGKDCSARRVLLSLHGCVRLHLMLRADWISNLIATQVSASECLSNYA